MIEINTFSTDDVEVTEKIPYWDETLSQAFTGKSIDVASPQSFRAKFDLLSVGDQHYANVLHGPSKVIHAKAHAKASSPSVIIHMQLFGQTRNRQDDRVVNLRPGEFTICDSERPYEVENDQQMGLFVMKMEKGKFEEEVLEVSSICCRKFDGRAGSGKVFFSFIQNYWHELITGLPSAEAIELSDVGMNLLRVCLRSGNERDDRPSLLRNREQLIKEYIHKNLSDPELGPQIIAGAFAMSVRNLHKIFSVSHMTVNRYIRAQRLELARSFLQRLDCSELPVTEISHRCGFTNPSQFSTNFKDQFGVTPRKYREAVLGR